MTCCVPTQSIVLPEATGLHFNVAQIGCPSENKVSEAMGIKYKYCVKFYFAKHGAQITQWWKQRETPRA